MIRKPRVHIIGGGFSGMMAAYFCASHGLDVTLSESEHWGGILRSDETPWGTAEAAANGFLVTDLLSRVASDLEVELLKPLPGAKQRWIANEKPERLPVTWTEAAGGATRFLWNRSLGTHRPRPQELLVDWGNRVLGRDLSQRLLLPAMQGIYAVDSRQLSATLVMGPPLSKGRAKRGGFTSPRKGMTEWTEKMRAHLLMKNVKLRDQKLSELPDADHVIVATSAAAKVLLLSGTAPLAARALDKIKTTPMVSVTTFWEKTPQDFPGFGILFHPDHKWNTSGVLFNNQIFEGRSRHRSERYFFARPSDLHLSDAELLSRIHEQRARLDWKNPFLGMTVHRWPKALPLYSLELESLLSDDWQLPTGLHLLGNEMGEIGLTALAEHAFHLANRIAGKNV